MQLVAYWPVAIFAVIAAAFGTLLLMMARFLGPRRPSAEKDMPYECGKDPLEPPGGRFSARFYRVAILFLLFDIEAVFLYPWAVLYRELSCKGKIDAGGFCQGAVSAYGFWAMAVFLAVMVLALVYVWRRKALQWD